MGFALGAVGILATWLVAKWYYQRSKRDSQDAVLAVRLDKLSIGDQTFLVALEAHKEPLPLYSLIAVEYELLDGTRRNWASNTCIMRNSVEARAPGSLCINRIASRPEDEITITLTGRGRENAAYLARSVARSATFTQADAEDQVRAELHSHYGFPPRSGG